MTKSWRTISISLQENCGPKHPAKAAQKRSQTTRWMFRSDQDKAPISVRPELVAGLEQSCSGLIPEQPDQTLAVLQGRMEKKCEAQVCHPDSHTDSGLWLEPKAHLLILIGGGWKIMQTHLSCQKKSEAKRYICTVTKFSVGHMASLALVLSACRLIFSKWNRYIFPFLSSQ